MAKPTNDLGRDRVGTLLVRLALPAIAAQLINALYNIVDRMYIGHIEGVGDVALTGLGVCFPVLMFISALSALVGMGGGSRAAIRMGEGREDLANEILGSCAALLAVISAAVTVVFQLLKEPMLLLFGASGNTIGYAADYLGVYLWGTLFVQVSLGLNNFITTQGFSTYSMATVVIGAVTNIVLDPIFIFGFGMGVKGAALATILAQGVSALWVLSFLRGRRTRLRLQARCLRLRWSILAPVVAIGVSPFIMQSTESLVNIALNSSLKHYGGDLYVGAMTIASSIMQVLWMPFQGLAQGAQPIIGYNYGAGSLDRVKRCFSLMLRFSLLLSVAGWAAVELFPGVFVALFNNKPELVALTVRVLRIYMAGFFMMGLQSACQQTFVALGQARVSLFLALLRKVILLIPLIYLLPLLLTGNQVFAVYLAEPAADLLAATATGLVFLRRFPRILEARRKQLGA
ncbi:MATE family efflux transporter [Flavonifractor sp. DFI.6.63]|uniref:MATE family efflux transporter n=1 Tax=Flavonifractor sp. DFI.6.63 TaxID=2963704 RepID=UPI00210DB935|nr:MATE family efflux transporter [Flavonifractor sp. DFI.6.63]MBS1383442.1 MATE family efflux transporter [Flavonifractor sp.]MCQ5028032.1 MATE family efflux transporter [Flavonifractor sp. DFI.6.63]MDU2195591.1 MATE family efflux transporter [Clostridiales bacterium]